ncbi:Bifunctional chorismate mutase/prephenate dehydratase [Buchnera aphidicola (Neophyllaphis podocarpi)]|uniref:chorismate mutase n=1 Tax=Buchnera aphidicola TaxID=9 RepID=UPI0034646572
MISDNSLIFLRKKINTIDEEILLLLHKRKKIAIEIAKIKIDRNKPIRDIKREKELINKLIKIGDKKDLESNYIYKIFKIIIKNSVNIQNNLLEKYNNKNKIYEPILGFLGPKGSYSNLATTEYASKNFNKFSTKGLKNFQEVINNLCDNKINYAVLPLENNNSGTINEVYDLIEKNDNLYIVGEIYILIDHCLLTTKNVKNINNIKKIYSHPQPVQQCSKFINQIKNCNIQYTSSTSSAMQIISNTNLNDIAAIGSKLGSNFYKLKILKDNISNKKNNITHFIILSNEYKKNLELKKSKTSFIIEVKNNITDLIEILLIIKENDLKVTKIESRPASGSLWNKTFYIDIQSHCDSQNMQKVIKKIDIFTNRIRILGCYPICNSFDKILKI